MEKNILRVISILILLGGFYVFIKPDIVAKKIKAFYSNYPLIHYAGEKQFTSRLGFIRFAGIIVVVVGLICFLSI